VLCSCCSFRAGGSAGCTLLWPSFHANPDRHHPPASGPLPRGVGTKRPPGPTVSPPPLLTLLVLLLGDHGHGHGGRGHGLAAAGQPADLERPEGALQCVFGGGRVLLLRVSLPVCRLSCRPVIHLQPHELSADALAVKDEGGSPLRPQEGTAAPRAGMANGCPLVPVLPDVGDHLCLEGPGQLPLIGAGPRGSYGGPPRPCGSPVWVGSAQESPEDTREGLPITTPTVSQVCYSHPSFQNSLCPEHPIFIDSVVPAPGMQGARWGDIRPGLNSRAPLFTCLSEPLSTPLCPLQGYPDPLLPGSLGCGQGPQGTIWFSAPSLLCSGQHFCVAAFTWGRTGLRSPTGRRAGWARPPWPQETWTAGWMRARWSPRGPRHLSHLRGGVGGGAELPPRLCLGSSRPSAPKHGREARQLWAGGARVGSRRTPSPKAEQELSGLRDKGGHSW